jgi:CBS domain-containing protein
MTAPGGTAERLPGAAVAAPSVGDLMHPAIFSCAPEAPLREAARLMAAHGVHAVAVLGDDEEGGLWGIVADADLVAALARRELGDHAAGALVRSPVVTVSRDETLARAAELMTEHRVTHLVVVDPEHRPVGILSTLDVVRAAASGLAG